MNEREREYGVSCDQDRETAKVLFLSKPSVAMCVAIADFAMRLSRELEQDARKVVRYLAEGWHPVEPGRHPTNAWATDGYKIWPSDERRKHRKMKFWHHADCSGHPPLLYVDDSGSKPRE